MEIGESCSFLIKLARPELDAEKALDASVDGERLFSFSLSEASIDG